jgi:3-phenylpropionate/cinnamic acid dioxygenase small subunit
VDGYFVDAIKYNDLKSKSAFFGAREHVNIMRDLDALLNSLVNIDRDSLVAILTSEAEAAERLANSIRTRTRTSTQRLKRQQAVELATRINRILLFFRHDETGPHMSDADLALCKSLERKLIIRG